MAALEKASTAPAARAIILELDSSKLKIEEEMQVLIDDLEDSTNGSPAGVASPLCDAEGYPRPDIDIFATRQKRHRLNCLRNDRKEVMRQIEEALHEVSFLLDCVCQCPPSEIENVFLSYTPFLGRRTK